MKLEGFIGGSYVDQSPIADQELTVNWYPQTPELPGASPALYPTPGVELIGEVFPGGGGRAHLVQDGREFVVIGPTFVEIDSVGDPIVATAAAIAVDSNPATITSNGAAGGQLLITSGGNAYIFTMATNAFVQVAALNGLATMGDQLDGYFLVINAATGTWYFSALNDGLTWVPGVNFINRSIASDRWIALKVINRYIWLFGSETSEIWYDAGTFPRPFAPYVSAPVPYGIAAPFSAAAANGAMHWVGRSVDGTGMILQAPGTTPTVISTFALSNKLAAFTTLADGIGDTYTSRGHTFYRVDFDTAEETISYDLNTQLWHDRGTWISEENRFIALRPRFHAFAFGEHRMLDSSTGALYRSDETIFTDVDGRPIRRIRRTPVVFDEDERIFLNSFELNAEVGIAPLPQDPLLELYQYTSGFWQLEETGAALRVDQVGNNDLTPRNAPANAVGIIGNAVVLSKVGTQTLSITDAAQIGLNPGFEDFSISLWVYPTSVSAMSFHTLCSKGCAADTALGAEGFWILLIGTGQGSPPGSIAVLMGDDVHGTRISSGAMTVLALNTWSHVVVTFDRDANGSLYVNGVLTATWDISTRAGDCTPPAEFAIGSLSDNVVPGGFNQYFDGRIDAALFARVLLTQQQVSVLYSGGAGRQMQASDIGLWQPNDGSDPRVMFRQSKDGGKTWGIERWRSAGKTGEYSTRIMWDRIGAGRRRVFEVSTTDNIEWRLLGGFVKPRPGQRGSGG